MSKIIFVKCEESKRGAKVFSFKLAKDFVEEKKKTLVFLNSGIEGSFNKAKEIYGFNDELLDIKFFQRDYSETVLGFSSKVSKSKNDVSTVNLNNFDVIIVDCGNCIRKDRRKLVLNKLDGRNEIEEIHVFASGFTAVKANRNKIGDDMSYERLKHLIDERDKRIKRDKENLNGALSALEQEYNDNVSGIKEKFYLALKTSNEDIKSEVIQITKKVIKDPNFHICARISGDKQYYFFNSDRSETEYYEKEKLEDDYIYFSLDRDIENEDSESLLEDSTIFEENDLIDELDVVKFKEILLKVFDKLKSGSFNNENFIFNGDHFIFNENYFIETESNNGCGGGHIYEITIDFLIDLRDLFCKQ